MISQPLNVGRKPTRRWAYFMSILTWLYSTAFAALPFFGVGKYVPEGYLTSCTFNYLSHDWSTKIFILAFFIGAWVVPLSIIVYSYSSIVRAVAQSRRAVAQAASSTASGSASAGIYYTISLILPFLNDCINIKVLIYHYYFRDNFQSAIVRVKGL